MYYIRCTIYYVLYTIHYYTLLYTTIHYIHYYTLLYTILYTLYTILYTLYTRYCILYTLHYLTPHTKHYPPLNTQHSTLSLLQKPTKDAALRKGLPAHADGPQAGQGGRRTAGNQPPPSIL
jgi:hypothetical protein